MPVTGHEMDHVVFIVRLARGSTGRMTGVVERVRTGEKERVAAVEEIGPVLAAMLKREEMATEKGERTCSRERGTLRSSS
jgi:hypothetical protein